jgi:hypothetical protein
MKTMILLDHLGFSEQNYEIIKEINTFVIDSLEEVSIIVNDVSTKMMEVNTAVNNIAEMGCFQNGLLMATNLLNAGHILEAKTSSRKLLYLWDVDWLHTAFNYEWLYDILTNDRLDIIVRSEEHKRALKVLCNKEPLGILQNFKMETLWTLL